MLVGAVLERRHVPRLLAHAQLRVRVGVQLRGEPERARLVGVPARAHVRTDMIDARECTSCGSGWSVGSCELESELAVSEQLHRRWVWREGRPER